PCSGLTTWSGGEGVGTRRKPYLMSAPTAFPPLREEGMKLVQYASRCSGVLVLSALSVELIDAIEQIGVSLIVRRGPKLQLRCFESNICENKRPDSDTKLHPTVIAVAQPDHAG